MVKPVFFKRLFLNPRSTGALFPSSRYLARSMANCIQKNHHGFVVELGPGTGVITKAILESGIANDKLISIELSPYFVNELKKEFPNIIVVEGDATQLSELIFDQKPIHTIISSLPLRSIFKDDREKIFNEIQKVLIPSGQFIQFTYALKKDRNFYPPHFKLIKSFIVWWNMPPARIEVFELTV